MALCPKHPKEFQKNLPKNRQNRSLSSWLWQLSVFLSPFQGSMPVVAHPGPRRNAALEAQCLSDASSLAHRKCSHSCEPRSGTKQNHLQSVLIAASVTSSIYVHWISITFPDSCLNMFEPCYFIWPCSTMQFDPWALALTGLDGEEPPTEPDFATGASPARRHCWEGTTWGPRSGAWDTLSWNLGTRKEMEGDGRRWKKDIRWLMSHMSYVTTKYTKIH